MDGRFGPMMLDQPAVPAFAPLSLLRERAVDYWQSAGCRATLLAMLVCGSFAAADEIRPAVPSVVISASGFDEVTGDGLRLLEMAGATQRAAQLQTALALLSGAQGIDRDRPLGVLVYLSQEEKQDPNLVAFLPVSDMDDLQQSIARFERITLAPLEETGWWELRAGRTTVPIRVSGGYAFVALRKELLSDPRPPIEMWTATHADYGVAATIHRSGIPSELIDRALVDLHAQIERDSQKKSDETDSDYEFRSRVAHSLGWLIEHGLQDFDLATVGLSLPADSDQVAFDAVISAVADTELARVMSGIAGDASQFESIADGEAPLAAAATWTLSGDAQQLASDLIERLRKDIERRMQQDGTANGPAAKPIREIIDALAATVADGRIDGCLQFQGERPGEMLLLAAVQLSESGNVANALENLLPLIAETPSVADLELNAVRVDGIDLHRLTFEAIRRQDEWLYGPDLGLYLGAGRNAIWLAVGGYDREGQLQALLERPSAAAGERPPVLQIDLNLAPWLAADTGPNGKQLPLLKAAREAFAQADDRLHVELTSGRAEVRLQGTLEAGYIRLLGDAWRAKQRGTSDGAPPNLAAPILPKP